MPRAPPARARSVCFILFPRSGGVSWRGLLGGGVLLAALAVAGCEQAPFGDAERARRGPVQARFQLDPADIKRGRAVYQRHCLTCHGPAGKGTVLDWRIRDADGRLPPPPLDDSSRTSLLATGELLDIVREGRGNMPPWKHTLSGREIEDVVTYIKSLWTPAVYRLWWSVELRAQKE
ncbi:MAG: c-type cytochrome [Gammaproteobacteria bacterium]